MRDMFIRNPKLDVIDGFSFNNPADVKRLTEGYDWADLSPRHPEKLTAFKAKGGKVIYWHGIADPGIPVSEIITHYKDLQQSVPASSRSEEHTSELQSLMRISYAVFCLKKKTITTYTTNNTIHQK